MCRAMCKYLLLSLTWMMPLAAMESEREENKSLFTGYGKLTLVDENGAEKGWYRGHFKDGLFHGWGRLVLPSGMTFKGSWSNGRADGYVEMVKYRVDTNGGLQIVSRQMDIWANGQNLGPVEVTQGPHRAFTDYGEGRYKENDIYQGIFLNGRRYGHGTITFASGNTCNSEWPNDDAIANHKATAQQMLQCITAVGAVQIEFASYNSADSWNGVPIREIPSGYGTIRYKNGDSYTGKVFQGLRDGAGIYTVAASHQTIQGNWFRNEFLGQERIVPGFSTLSQSH